MPTVTTSNAHLPGLSRTLGTRNIVDFWDFSWDSCDRFDNTIGFANMSGSAHARGLSRTAGMWVTISGKDYLTGLNRTMGCPDISGSWASSRGSCGLFGNTSGIENRSGNAYTSGLSSIIDMWSSIDYGNSSGSFV